MNETLELMERLKAIREALNMNQMDFAARLDISCTSISDMEKGEYKPNFDFIQKCATEFRINLYYLVFGEGEMFAGEKPAISGTGYVADITDVRNFLYHFERSSLVQYQMLSYFSSFYHREEDVIKYQLDEYEKKFNK
jgi:transcriptional regulator with XRE-family HTH domain